MFSIKRLWVVLAVALVGAVMAVVATARVDVVASPDAGVAPIGEDTFRPLSPARLLDTRRASAVKLGPGGTLVLQVTGQGGKPGM